MKAMDHLEVEEVLAAYVLGALPPQEASRVEAHLRDCPEHREAAAQLQSSASRLALAADDVPPPSSLRQRVLEAVEREAAGRSARGRDLEAPGVTGEETVPPAARSTPVLPAPRLKNAWRRPRPALLAAAAAVLLALGIGVVAGTRIAQPPQQAWTFHGNTLAPDAEASVIYDRGRHTAVVAVTGLPELKAGQVYEVWLIQSDRPVDAGISAGSGGKAVVRVAKDISQFEQLAITIEPGEQTRPTTDPVLAGKLS